MGQTNKMESFKGERSERDEGMKEVIFSDRLLINNSMSRLRTKITELVVWEAQLRKRYAKGDVHPM
jgi:hypothetical protein